MGAGGRPGAQCWAARGVGAGGRPGPQCRAAWGVGAGGRPGAGRVSGSVGCGCWWDTQGGAHMLGGAGLQFLTFPAP